MPKRLLVAIVALVAAGAVAVPAFGATTNAAQKEPFFDNPVPTCDGPIDGTPSHSFAIIKRNGNGVISAEVVLINAQPDTTYTAVIQTEPGCEFSDEVEITTDGQGDGSGHVTFTDPGATQALVYTFTFSDQMQTPLYTFGSK